MAARIGRIVGIDPAYLLFSEATSVTALTANDQLVRLPSSAYPNTPRRIPVLGYAEGGVWRVEGGAMGDKYHGSFSDLVVLEDPRYARKHQFGLIIRGTMVDRFASDGDVVTCVDHRGARRRIRDNDLLVIESFDKDGRQELTIKRGVWEGGHIRLHWHSNDPRWQGEVVLEDPDNEVGTSTRIVGVVTMMARIRPE
jgi:hypothetical protein